MIAEVFDEAAAHHAVALAAQAVTAYNDRTATLGEVLGLLQHASHVGFACWISGRDFLNKPGRLASSRTA